MGHCLSCCSRKSRYSKAPTNAQSSDLNPAQVSKQESAMGLSPSMMARQNKDNSSSSCTDSSLPNPRVSVTPGQSCDSKSPSTLPTKFVTDRKLANTSAAPEVAKRTSSTAREMSDAKISAMFDRYRDASSDCILANGIEKLCHDLNLQPDEFRVLLLAWKFNAETMCCFTRTEFVTGCRLMRVDSLRSIQARLPDIIEEVRIREQFKDLYQWTFRFGLDQETLQRKLPVDMAMSLWKLVFTLDEPSILQRWFDFLTKYRNNELISRDTWNMFLNFVETVGSDLSNYNEADAWPSVFDDFAEYEHDRQNQNLIFDRLENESDKYS